MKQDSNELGLAHAALSLHAQPLALPRVTSEVLFNGAQQLVIEHAGEVYQLRITKQGKLILTK